MEELCYGSYDVQPLRGNLSDTLERIKAMCDESEFIKRELSKITICPEPCDDGTVFFSPAGRESQRYTCPLVNHNCAYGAALEEVLEKRIDKIMLTIGVPRKHLNTFTMYHDTAAVGAGTRWSVQGFLILCGGVGVGKSFGAALAVRRYLRNRIPDRFDRYTWERAERAGRSVLWYRANRITYDRNAALRALGEPLLVIDGMGDEKNAGIGQIGMSDILYARCDANLPTIATTMLKISDIAAKYGWSLAETLTENTGGNGGMIVNCGAVSLRLGNDLGSGSKQPALEMS